MFNIDQTDFPALVHHLRHLFRDIPIEGLVVGRTRLRDATAQHLKCSQSEAERLVETMIACNLVVFERELDGAGSGGWRIHAD